MYVRWIPYLQLASIKCSSVVPCTKVETERMVIQPRSLVVHETQTEMQEPKQHQRDQLPHMAHAEAVLEVKCQ